MNKNSKQILIKLIALIIIILTIAYAISYKPMGFKIQNNSAANGCLNVTYYGNAEKALVVLGSNNSLYNTKYILKREETIDIPLNMGFSIYKVRLYVETDAGHYRLIAEKGYEADKMAKTLSLLNSNVYVNYNSECDQLSKEYQRISLAAIGITDYIDKVYKYVYNEIKYDDELAADILNGKIEHYIPNIENTINSQKGICLDKASLTAALLRKHNIQTKLVIGHANSEYHAWNEILIDGKWVVIDTTLGINLYDKYNIDYRESTIY